LRQLGTHFSLQFVPCDTSFNAFHQHLLTPTREGSTGGPSRKKEAQLVKDQYRKKKNEKERGEEPQTYYRDWLLRLLTGVIIEVVRWLLT
jgi:hypothetical protein